MDAFVKNGGGGIEFSEIGKLTACCSRFLAELTADRIVGYLSLEIKFA